jgi:subtilisin family serine protease
MNKQLLFLACVALPVWAAPGAAPGNGNATLPEQAQARTTDKGDIIDENMANLPPPAMEGQQVRVFGELRDRTEIGFDVDGDKISEHLNQVLENSPNDPQEIEVKIIDGYLLSDEITKILGKDAASNYNYYTDHGLNHVIATTTAPNIRRIANLPLVEAVMSRTSNISSPDLPKAATGINYACASASGIGQPQGCYSVNSRINGDKDGNVNSYTSNDVVVAVLDSGVDDNHAAFPGTFTQDPNKPKGIGMPGPKINVSSG